MAVVPWFEIGMWKDGFPVLSPGMARLILFSLFGNCNSHRGVQLSWVGNRSLHRFEHQVCYVEVTSWRGWKKWAVSFEKGEQCSGCWVARGYICQFLPASLFVAKDASGCSHVKEQSWNRKVYLDFPFWFAEFSVFTSMLTFLTFMLFMLACSSAGTLPCFIFLAMILVFADISQTLNSCCGGHLHQTLPSTFQLKQIHRNS